MQIPQAEAGETTSQVPYAPLASAEAPQDAPSEGTLWKGAVAGAVAGAAGAFVMEKFQTKALPKIKEWAGLDEQESGESSSSGEESEPATAKAASAIAEPLLGRELEDDEKKIASEASHYTMGITSGIIYGMTAEKMPLATIGFGAGFGAAVWAIADEAVVPALGLSKPPTEYGWKTHAYALASHVVYGVTTESVRRTVRSGL